MKIRTVLFYLTSMSVGATVESLALVIRFNDEFLRKELVLMMSESNSYFQLFFYLNLLFSALLVSTYLLLYRRGNKRT